MRSRCSSDGPVHVKGGALGDYPISGAVDLRLEITQGLLSQSFIEHLKIDPLT
jgi:hypothetical protein